MLQPFFNPAAVAVIGASTNPTYLGTLLLRNLLDGSYARRGKVYPIHPVAKELLGHPAYRSVLDVPDPVDLAVIVVSASHVAAALHACGQKGIPAAIVISAGFRESGAEGCARERELLAIARQYNIRLIGPNCLGVIDTASGLNATFAADPPPQGPVAFISQSGALGAAVLDWACAGHLGLSKFVSLGNKADVSEVDVLRYCASDPQTRLILCYIEELSDGQAFMRAAREVSRVKPIIALKAGVTPSGTRAAASHTGALAGAAQAYHAAFRQVGVVQVSSMEALLDSARALSTQPPLAGDRIAVVTNGGGPGILAADALEQAGLRLACLAHETVTALRQHMPEAASTNNPVDVLGDARAERYRQALAIVAADPGVDGMLVVLTPQAMTEVAATAEAVSLLARQCTKPVLASFMGEVRVQAGVEILTAHSVPNYPFPERAAGAFRAMADEHALRGAPAPQGDTFAVDRATTRHVIDQARAEGRTAIGDGEARAILHAYGLRVPHTELAETPEQAVAIARRIGYPVVLKIASPDILHKTDVGGVRIGMTCVEDVRDAFEWIVDRVRRSSPAARLQGCLVQQMVPPGGLEVFAGAKRDPQFGPLVTFGLGGIYVEALQDAVFRVAPVSRAEAEAMLSTIRARALLDGVRGQPPVDKAAIVDALLRVSQLVQDFPEIAELDINPLVVYPVGQGAIALDARMMLLGLSEG
jgi:acetyltransferase